MTTLLHRTQLADRFNNTAINLRIDGDNDGDGSIRLLVELRQLGLPSRSARHITAYGLRASEDLGAARLCTLWD